ncbi:helix-turn-helix domain-containing protein [Streptomyces sp. NPDC053427]|uniref:helix-turn-helix domain-containing protein n=1 Tax=Streptomyces sp. NPDC053427 TaxID=3365701 RepID=UPI0037D5B88A
MTHYNNHGLGDIEADSPAGGFEEVMHGLDAMTPEQRAALELQAEQAELGHDAYALGMEYRGQGRLRQAERWLRTAVRYQVSGAQLMLDEISDALPTAGSGTTTLERPCRLAAAISPTPDAPAVQRPAPDGLDIQQSHLKAGPTVQRILLGAQLRRLREAAELSSQQATKAICRSGAYLARLECGRRAPNEADLLALLKLYGVTDPHTLNQFVELARGCNEVGWWHSYSDVMPDWFQAHLDLEQAASTIRTFETQFIPGLLQTPAYATAVTRLGDPTASAKEVEKRVTLRLRRQQILHGPNPPHLWAVVDEGALQRPPCGAEVMREQLRHIRTMVKRPNIAMQILPFAQSSGTGHPVTIFRFEESDCPDIAHFEQLSGGVFVNRREEVDSQRRLFSQLSVQATSPSSTVDLLDRLIEERSAACTPWAATVPNDVGHTIGGPSDSLARTHSSHELELKSGAKAVEALDELLAKAG